MGRKILVLVLFSLFSSFLASAAPVTEAEFDQHYRKKMRSAFCEASEFANCFPMKLSDCQPQFEQAYSVCQKEIFPKFRMEINELTSQKYAQLGSCIGQRLAAAVPLISENGRVPSSERKVACRQRPRAY